MQIGEPLLESASWFLASRNSSPRCWSGDRLVRCRQDTDTRRPASAKTDRIRELAAFAGATLDEFRAARR
jgi:hypothetical protein